MPTLILTDWRGCLGTKEAGYEGTRQKDEGKTGEQLLKPILAERNAAWEAAQRQKPAAKAKDGLLPSPFKLPTYKPPSASDNANLPPPPEGWTWLTVDTVGFVTKLAGFEYTKFVKYDPDGDLAVIKAENAGRSGFKRTDFSRVKSSTVANLTRSQLRHGDLLMVFVDAGTGNVARVPDDQPYFLGPNIGMIRIQSHDASPAYMEIFLRSPVGN